MTESREKVPELTHPWPVSPSLVATLPPELALTPEEIAQLEEPWQYLEAILAKLNELEGVAIDPSAEIASSAVLEGSVWVGPGAKIYHNSVVKGPTYIGGNAVVGDFTMVRGSYLGESAVAGANSEVVRCIIGDNSALHRAYVADSLIGSNVHFAGGSSTANERLDGSPIRSTNHHGEKVLTPLTKLGAIVGDNSAFGGYAMANPGIQVGSGCQIGQRVSLYSDVPDNMRVTFRQEFNFSEI